MTFYQKLETISFGEKRRHSESASRPSRGRGILEIMAALGLLVGLIWWPLGVAVAARAVVTHLRAGNKGKTPAAGLMAISIAALLLLAV